VTDRCPGCGLEAKPQAGPTHPYVGASPGCWGIFSTWSGSSLADPATGSVRQLVVDGYMVQHPGVPERRAIQSVGIHLMSLCLQLERGTPPGRAPQMIQRILQRPPDFRWLDPPRPNGALTIRDVAAAPAPAASDIIRGYAASIWAAWTPHHATVRAWLDRSLT
jgi:hypothetical protein